MKTTFSLCVSILFALALASNPFDGAEFFQNPDFSRNVRNTMQIFPEHSDLIQKVEHVSVAYWIDTMAKIANVSGVLDLAVQQQETSGHPVVAVFIVYDLPNRDCSAAASNGEISCEDATCAAGLTTYKTQYIDPIVAVFQRYPQLRIVVLLEPDSLPNLATNMNVPKCSAGALAYKQGVAYAIQQLSNLAHITIYLDAANGGWLGWRNNMQLIGGIFKEVLLLSGGMDKIRGFATNTAGYQSLGSLNSESDPCNFKSQYNFAIDEVHFVYQLDQYLGTVGIANKSYIIDTSRSGVGNARSTCSNWCNIKGAGIGNLPTSQTSFTGNTTMNNLIDALIWAKVPGESDGTSDVTSQRFDYHCSSIDSYIPSPEAGKWNADYFLALCLNANPPL